MKPMIEMMFRTALLIALVAIAGCVAPGRPAPHGPPPSAPEPGYQVFYQGHDLRYDANLGVYLIIGMPDYYYYRDHYYRFNRGRWLYSREFDRHWREYNQRKLPPGLVKKYEPEHDRGRDRGSDHDRGRDHGHDKRRGD